MKKLSVAPLLLLLLSSVGFGANNMITVAGTISDFSGNKLPGAVIHFHDDNLKPLYSATTDAQGKFQVEIENRRYKAIFAVKDYAVNFLEYWHWDYRPKQGESLDIKIDGIELYGMKAWKTSPAYPGIIVYVRPMSLKRWKEAGQPKSGVAPITPELGNGDISATLNGATVSVRGFNRIKEFITEKDSLDAFLVHVDPGTLNFPDSTLCLTLHDQMKSERGMGCVDFKDP